MVTRMAGKLDRTTVGVSFVIFPLFSAAGANATAAQQHLKPSYTKRERGISEIVTV